MLYSPKNRPNHENKPTPHFWIKLLQGCFSLEVCPHIYAVHTVLLSKKHRRTTGTVQKEALTNEGRHDLLLLHKQVHDKETLQNHCIHIVNNASLTMCEVGIFSWEVSHATLDYAYPPVYAHDTWTQLQRLVVATWKSGVQSQYLACKEQIASL